MPSLDRLRFLSPHEGLHHLILELPYVARPAHIVQALLRLRSEPAGRKTERMALSPNTMRGKWKNVCGPLAERGKLDVNDFQTEEEVLSKPSALNLFERDSCGSRRSNESPNDADRPRPAADILFPEARVRGRFALAAEGPRLRRERAFRHPHVRRGPLWPESRP